MGKNNRKTKREQAAKLLAAGFAHTDEEDAGGQPIQRSQSSSTTRPPDALVASSLEPERGTTPIAQSPQSGHRWASSPLPPLTPSRSERAVKAMLSSPMDPSVEIQSETGRRATSESFATSLRRDSVDFNETPHSGVRSAVSEPILQSDRLQEAVSIANRTNTPTHHGDRGSLNEHSSTAGDDMDERARAERRAEKKRRNRAESIESAELQEAVRRSLEDNGRSTEDRAAHRAKAWEDANLRAAYAALARERHTDENSEEFRRRQAALRRNENELRELRISDDGEFAAEVQAQIAQMEADRELAEAIAEQDRKALERRRERLASAQRALDKEEADIAEAARRTKSVTPKPVMPVQMANPISPKSTTAPPRQRRATVETATGKSGIEDQGIAWDERGTPFEMASAKSRGSSVGTRGGMGSVRTRDKTTRGQAQWKPAHS
ncbi:hypothetical protein B0H13DRAFT_2484940 [Mycena leptocephala]|nr:hypothetical protein B0H13DRAFT_2484940 [Mycena leptocephala]